MEKRSLSIENNESAVKMNLQMPILSAYFSVFAPKNAEFDLFIDVVFVIQSVI